ncbi:MAG: hypothetical protein AB1555_15655 [Nitrospirota bacterium]
MGARACQLLIGLTALLAVPALVQAEGAWSSVVGAKVSYTTDVFQFSAARRLALAEDPSQPTVVPLDKPEDVIWEPSVEVTRAFSTWLGRNEVSVKGHGFLYTDKAIFNHGDYRIQTRQWLGSDTSILFRYRYLPNLFLGPNFERRTGQRLMREERVTTHRWRFEVDREVADSWRLSAIGRYGIRLYNEPFAERDTQFFAIGPQVAYTPVPWVTATVGYLYERGLADGREEPQVQDDVSYYLHVLSVGAEFRPIERLALNLAYLHLRKTFTSSIAGDIHLGRFDTTHQGLVEFRYQITPATGVSVSYQRTQRSSNVVTRSFHDNIVSLGGEHRF